MLQAEYEFIILWGTNHFNIFFRQFFGLSRLGSGFFGYRLCCKPQYATPRQVARPKGNEHQVADPIQEPLAFHCGYPFNMAWANTGQDGTLETIRSLRREYQGVYLVPDVVKTQNLNKN